GFKITYESVNKNKTQLEQLSKIPDAKLREQIKQQILAPTYYDLLFSGNTSLYKKTEENKEENNLSDKNKNPNIKVMVVKNESTGIYQNYKTGEYVSAQNFFGKDFYISDKTIKFHWKISNETKKIGNFNCKKATSIYNEKPVEAWFSDEIPISVGPDVYNGLPGLIIQLDYDERTYNAISVEKLSNKIDIEKPQQKGKVVTREEFIKIQNERL
ncbi:MAG: GLPGLI family protein, partial [Capnocytophaga sp.]|nr:GLPGLI family protein [Capnocytophaga sp.]